MVSSKPNPSHYSRLVVIQTFWNSSIAIGILKSMNYWDANQQNGNVQTW
jgi:hypothetical protein